MMRAKDAHGAVPAVLFKLAELLGSDREYVGARIHLNAFELGHWTPGGG